MMRYGTRARDELFFYISYPHCFILGMGNTSTENNYRLLSTIELLNIITFIRYFIPDHQHCTSCNKEIFLNNFVNVYYRVSTS